MSTSTPKGTMKPRRSGVRVLRTAVAGSSVVMLAGCSFTGLNSLDMPGTRGHGAGSFTITVELPDVATLPQNSPVMVDDVTVGSVSGVEAVQDPETGEFHAAVKLSLDSNVDLPANATATVAQTSLLGSQHVELAAPAGDEDTERLQEGSTIPLSNAGIYPTTEQVLSALGVVVNKGNLGQLEEITNQAFAAVSGRAGSFATLLPRLAELTGSLRQQTGDIIAAMEGLNRFAGSLAANKEDLSQAIATLPAALSVLNENKTNIVNAFAALEKLATVASHVLSETKTDFAEDLNDLYPLIKALSDSSDNFIDSLQLLPTFPFKADNIQRAIRGDYMNVFVTFDLTLRRLGESIFTTSALDPNMAHMDEIVNAPDWLMGSMANLSGQAADPFQMPSSSPEPAPTPEGQP